MNWEKLMGVEGVDLELFDRLISSPVRHICQTNLGMHVVGHKLNPVRLMKRMKRRIKGELGFAPTHLGLHLAKYMPCMNIKLSELPKPRFSLKGGVPRFVFCGCDLSTGKPFYFTQEVVGHCLSVDAKVKHHAGAYPIISEALTRAIPLTQAVSASAAVPLVFEPLTIKIEINGRDFVVGIVDGAVYDNLGLDPLIGEDNSIMLEGCLKSHQVVFVNDAGAAWFLPLERFSGRSMIRRVMRSLTIAISRGHDERVRFLDLMFKRHLLYGAYWRLADLERIYDKFSEKDIEELQELCFPSKQLFDPLLIARIVDFRTDLNELTSAELRVLENAGYILAAFKFHKYVSPLLRDKHLVDTENFRATFRLPVSHNAGDISREISDLIDALKNSNSLVKSNITLKPHRHKKTKTPYECQFQFSQNLTSSTSNLPIVHPGEWEGRWEEEIYEEEWEEDVEWEEEVEREEGEEGMSGFEQQMNEFLSGTPTEEEEEELKEYANEESGTVEINEDYRNEETEGDQCDSSFYSYPHDPNHPLYHRGKFNGRHTPVIDAFALPPQ